MRLIDADAFERRCMFDPNIQDMQDVIYALRDYPTVDAVPVVRCKDCKYAEFFDDRITCDYTTEWLDPNGYCNMGEKDDAKMYEEEEQ